MARSQSSAGYPEAFARLIVQVGKLGEDVLIPWEGMGVKSHSLRTTLQAYFAAVKKEGLVASADKYMQERGMYAEKIVVRIQGEFIRVSHRDHDGVGKAINEAIDKALASKGVTHHNGLAESTRDRQGPTSENIPLGMTVLQAERAAMRGELEALPDVPLAAEVANGPAATSAKLPPIQSAPGSMLDMVAGEVSEPRGNGVQKYKRADGRSYPAEADGEPTWGFTEEGEPKVNQFF
jgi:hypothetical protein